jgi:hypothetical protein
MKAISKAIFIIICLTFSCNTDDSLSAPELKRKVDELKTQITGIMDVSTGETSDDCRTRYIQGGDGCGPIYVYGVVGIDTLELENLFADSVIRKQNCISLKADLFVALHSLLKIH